MSCDLSIKSLAKGWAERSVATLNLNQEWRIDLQKKRASYNFMVHGFNVATVLVTSLVASAIFVGQPLLFLTLAVLTSKVRAGFQRELNLTAHVIPENYPPGAKILFALIDVLEQNRRARFLLQSVGLTPEYFPDWKPDRVIVLDFVLWKNPLPFEPNAPKGQTKGVVS